MTAKLTTPQRRALAAMVEAGGHVAFHSVSANSQLASRLMRLGYAVHVPATDAGGTLHHYLAITAAGTAALHGARVAETEAATVAAARPPRLLTVTVKLTAAEAATVARVLAERAGGLDLRADEAATLDRVAETFRGAAALAHRE